MNTKTNVVTNAQTKLLSQIIPRAKNNVLADIIQRKKMTQSILVLVTVMTLKKNAIQLTSVQTIGNFIMLLPTALLNVEKSVQATST